MIPWSLSEREGRCPQKRQSSALRVLLASIAAVVLLALMSAPAGAAPDDTGNNPDFSQIPAGAGGLVKDNDQYQCTQAKDGTWQGDCDSDIAKQCDSEKEVDPKFSDTWIGLSPAVVGCAAIASLDWTIQALGLSLDATEVYLYEEKGQNKGQWFQEQYRVVRTIAVWTIPPIFFIALIHALFSGRYDRMLQAGLVYLPISLIGSVIAIVFVQYLLYISDDISEVFQNSISGDAQLFMVSIARGFGPEGYFVSGGGSSAWVMSIILALGILLATAVVYIILSLREASIYIAALFFPIIFAMLIWPPLHKHFKKLVEFIIGMIISKIVMVAAISLMVAAMASITGFDSAASQGLGLDGQSTADEEDDQAFVVWISQCITLIFTFFVVCFAPNIPSKLFANVGFEETARIQTPLMNRPDMKRRIDWGNRMVGIATQAAGFREVLTQWGPARNVSRQMNAHDHALRSMGIRKQPYSKKERLNAGFGTNPVGPDGAPPDFGSKQYFNNFGDVIVKDWGASKNHNEKYFADLLMSVGGKALESFEINQGRGNNAVPGVPHASPYGFQVAIWQRQDRDGNLVRCAEIQMNTFDENNNPISVLPQAVTAAIQETLAAAETAGPDGKPAPLAQVKVHLPGVDLTTPGNNLNGNTGQVFGPSDTRRPGIIQANAIDAAIKKMAPSPHGTVVTLVRDAYATQIATMGTAPGPAKTTTP
jgi:hypothetical protein